jgi:hypothetical protein
MLPLGRNPGFKFEQFVLPPFRKAQFRQRESALQFELRNANIKIKNNRKFKTQRHATRSAYVRRARLLNCDGREHLSFERNPSRTAASRKFLPFGDGIGNASYPAHCRPSRLGPMSAPGRARATLLTWVHGGAAQSTYDVEIKPIIDKRCMTCHDGRNPHLPTFWRSLSTSALGT